MSVDEVLAAWAGGGTIEAAAPAAATPAADETPSPPEKSEPLEVDVPAEGAVAATSVVPAESPAPAATVRASVPAEVAAAEASHLSEVVTVPTAGIRERTSFRIPAWLVAVFLIIPVFALVALGGSATGTCGEDTELATDVITGDIVNCDGSEFTGSGIGGGTADFIAMGEAIYMGSGVSGVNCSGCHGASGGGGVGPALNGVLTTFGACADHEEWVHLGTPGFQAAGRSTYGDTNKPVGGGGTMPPHPSLTDEQLASVVSFERVRFGGADVDQTLADCGLVEADGGGESGPTGSTVPGETPGTTVPGETTPTTATEAAAVAP
jgi:mono/diheme cytochrome c family protein